MQDDIAPAPAHHGGLAGGQPRRSVARHLAEVQLLLDQAPSFLALTQGPAHVVAITNEAYLRLVGRNRDDVVGRPILESIPELRQQGLGPLLEEVLRTEEQRIGSAVRVQLRSGSDGSVTERRVDFILQPIFDASNATVGIFIQGLDVTDRELAIEALQQADRRKDNFLATLAHEMLSPLSASKVSVQLLVRTLGASGTGSDTMRLLGILQRQYASLAGLVEDLLDVSRIKLGKIALRIEDVVLQEAVRAAAETCQHLLDTHSHELDVVVPETPVCVKADRRRLVQVLTNVLVNAAKYTDPGGKIRIEVRSSSDAAEVIVSDNGRGMTAQQAERAFDLFHQNSVEDTLSGGLGIGLALVRQLIELQGGTVRAHSAGISEGTSIVIRLTAVCE